jgi:hypothetical protein
MPVAFSIGGDTTVVYPFINCNCVQITACGVRTRTKYPVVVLTNATSGVFRSLKHICCYPVNNLASIPAPAAVAPASLLQEYVAPVEIRTSTKRTTTKGVTKDE